MGEESFKDVTGYFIENLTGNPIRFDGLSSVALCEKEEQDDSNAPYIELFNTPIEFYFDVKPLYNKLSRKRFKKWLMSIGYSRNLAELYSKRICQKHISYKSMQLPFLIDPFGTVMFLMEE